MPIDGKLTGYLPTVSAEGSMILEVTKSPLGSPVTKVVDIDGIGTYLSGSGAINHSSLSGLSNDNHPQYPLVDGTRGFTGVVSGVTPTAPAHLATKSYVDGIVGVSDHGALSGLGDDDHTQYVLASGARAFTGTVGGVDPVASSDLATKNYVDTVGGISDHGALSGLGDDDHTQYALADGTRAFTGTVGGVTPVASSDLATKGYVDGAAVSDHGALAGLGDDDHTQYVLADGTRAFTGTVGGVTPVASADLATKGYVDGAIVADHGALSGLGDDDHTQYILVDGTRAFTGTVGGVTPVASSDLATKGYVDGAVGASDHGALTGLGDDDHTQYALVDGTRAFTGTIGGVDPVASSDLSTKNYVDTSTLPRTLEINNTPTGSYTLVSGDNGKFVVIDAPLTIPTGLPVGFQCTVFLDNGAKQTLTTTGLTVKGNDADASVSGNGVITLAIIATDTVFLAGEMEA